MSYSDARQSIYRSLHGSNKRQGSGSYNWGDEKDELEGYAELLRLFTYLFVCL